LATPALAQFLLSYSRKIKFSYAML